MKSKTRRTGLPVRNMVPYYTGDVGGSGNPLNTPIHIRDRQCADWGMKTTGSSSEPARIGTGVNEMRSKLENTLRRYGVDDGKINTIKELGAKSVELDAVNRPNDFLSITPRLRRLVGALLKSADDQDTDTLKKSIDVSIELIKITFNQALAKKSGASVSGNIYSHDPEQSMTDI